MMMSAYTRLLQVIWPFTREVFRRYSEDQGGVLSGYIAYAAMLSFMPFLIFATALTGFLIGAEGTEAALSSLFAAAPEHVVQTLEPVVREVIGERRGGILTISALGAIWGASNGVEAVRIALDRAYDVEETRNLILSRLFSIGIVLSGYLTFLLLAVLIIFAPLAFRLAEDFAGIQIPAAADLLRYVVGFLLLYKFLGIMHRALPARETRSLMLWPGIFASVIIWGAAATAFSVYLAYAPSYAVTYGALAGVIITLLFFYITGVAIIFGAEINAVLNADKLVAASGPADTSDAPG